MKFTYLICLFVFLTSAAIGGVLKGKVTDEKGGRLPYATIFLEGTTTGVNANGNGDFELTIQPGLYKVVCQYVGYKQSTYNLSITGTETVVHNFVLSDQSLEMKEVVVHANAEDPAYAIIRNTIKKRKFHLKQVKSFQSSIYLKGVARSRALPNKVLGQKVKASDMGLDSGGKGVLYLAEEDANYYAHGGKEKTVIHSVRESGNPAGLGFSKLPSIITFYENNVNVLEDNSRGFISPIGDNALNYYKYKLIGEFSEHGHTIYKIQVQQKRLFEPCFNGTIYIVDEDWAIHSLNMTLAKKSGMDIFDTVKVDQLFLPLTKDTWVIKSQVQYFTINLLGIDVTANFVTVYNNQKVNEAIPDSLFADKVTSFYDKTANKKDTSYWASARPIPLEKDEKKDFVVKDSIRKKITSPEHLDSLRRKRNKFSPFGLLTDGSSFSSRKYKNTYSVNPILVGFTTENMLNYNIVEGFDIAPKFTWRHMVDTGKYLTSEYMPRYGISNRHFNAFVKLSYLKRNREFLNSAWLYGVSGGKYVFQYNDANPVPAWFNTYSALLARQNDLKIYERIEASAFVKRNYGDGLSWSLKASYQKRMPLLNSTDYSVLPGNKDGYSNNTPPALISTATAWEKHDAVLVSAAISFKPGVTYTQYPDYKVAEASTWPRFTLQYEKGIPGLFNSKTDFDKWRFSIHDDVRLRLLGTLSYNVAAGGFLNSKYVSIPDLMHLYGNRGIGFASPYLQSFQFAQYYEFSNKEPIYGEAHAEYHLKGLGSNKLPLLRQARWYLLFGGNAFYASQNDYYSEAFVGLDNIGWKLVRVLRVDFVQSWDSHMGHNSGIRFGLNMAALQ